MSSREVLSLHIGQAGVQMGAAAWELYCLEHGVDADGHLVDKELSASESRRQSDDSGVANVDGSSAEPCHTFFAESASGKFSPRALFIDLEASVVDVLRTGENRRLFHPEQMISGQEDAANIFARGCFSLGRTVVDRVEDRIRKMTEQCDSLQGFVITDSAGGGTGSGLGCNLLNRLDADFSKETKLELCVQPSPRMASAVVEPYNGILHHGYTTGGRYRNGCCFILQNEAMYDVCHRQLDIERPSFSHVNALLAQVASSLTSYLRFPGSLNVDLTEFQTNLIPYPSLRYPLTSLAPLMSVEKAHYEQPTVAAITSKCVEKEQQLACCDPARGKYMSCCLLYRGDVSPSDVCKAMGHMKEMRSVQFVDWCPTGFKVGMNRFIPAVTPASCMAKAARSACMLYNSSAIAQTWQESIKQFSMLLHKRAFVHWYVGEGMEEGEFSSSLENILTMQKDYEEAAIDTRELANGTDSDNEY